MFRALDRIDELNARGVEFLEVVQNESRRQARHARRATHWLQKLDRLISSIDTASCPVPADIEAVPEVTSLCDDAEDFSASFRSFARDFGCDEGYRTSKFFDNFQRATAKFTDLSRRIGRCSGESKKDLEGFDDFSTISSRLFELAASDASTYELAELQSSGNALDAIRINLGEQPTIMIVCGMRANDFQSVQSCLELAESDLATQFPGMNFIVLPVANPSGYDYAFTTDRFWTKTRTDNSVCKGMDLTRNFEYNFEASDDPCSSIYSGELPLLAWEADALSSFIGNESLDALLVVETNDDPFSVVTPATQDTHSFRKLLPRVYNSAAPFTTTRPQESRSGFLEDSFVGQIERIATVQLQHGANSNGEDLRSLVDSFANDIIKKNSHSRAFLDDYVWAEDDVFNYEFIEMKEEDEVTVYSYNMTSLNWLDESVVSHSTWNHVVRLVVPNVVRNTENIFVHLGNYGNWPASQPPPLRKRRNSLNVALEAEYDQDLPRVKTFAVKTGVVCGLVNQIPNWPVAFTADGPMDPFIYPGPEGVYYGKHSDAMMAQAWKNFIDKLMTTGVPDYEQLAHAPMTKAAVRAIDLLAEETYARTGNYPFKVGMEGASKRGWAAWLVTAVDFERVNFNAPVMFDILNSVEHMKKAQQSYGGWSYPFFDYWVHQVPAYLGTAPLDLAMGVLDPISYASRYVDTTTYITNAANDEFLPLDSPLAYWDMLPGKKLLRILPDEGHGGSWGGWDRDEENVSEGISRTVDGPLSEATQDRLWTSLTAIYKAHVFAPETIPTVLTAFDEIGSSMTVTATSSRAPEATKLYSRNSKPGKRDWRKAYYAGEPVCGPEGISGIMAGIRLDMVRVLYNKQAV